MPDKMPDRKSEYIYMYMSDRKADRSQNKKPGWGSLEAKQFCYKWNITISNDFVFFMAQIDRV